MNNKYKMNNGHVMQVKQTSTIRVGTGCFMNKQLQTLTGKLSDHELQSQKFV
jgi:hypothetical protein